MKSSSKVLKICIMFLLLVTTIFSQERLVTLPGSIQSALGGKDWDPAGTITQMKKIGEDRYEFIGLFKKGNYEYKVAIDGAWTENYGSGGEKDGGNISLVVPSDNSEVKFFFDYKAKTISHKVAIKGFNYIPIITNKIEQKGKEKPITATNEVELGILSNNLDVKSKFSYNFTYDKDSELNKLTNLGKDADIKNLKIVDLTADYTLAGITAGIMVNKTNFKNSTDYLQILEVNKESDKRKSTKNIKDILADNYGFRLSTEKFAKVDIAVSKYMANLYADNVTEKTLAQVNVEKALLKNKLTLGTSNLFYQVTHADVNEDLVINGTVYGKLDLTKKLNIKGQLAYLSTGSILESKGATGTFKQPNGQWKFIFSPTDTKATKVTTTATINEVHLVGAMNSWTPSDKTYALTKQADGTWEGIFTVTEGNEYKFMYDSTAWSTTESPNNLKVEETVLSSEGIENGLNGYFAELNYKLGNKNKGNLQAGTKFLAANVYLPFANDDLLYRENYSNVNRTNGLVDYWLNADYQLTKNNKLIFKEFIRNTDKNNEKVNNSSEITLENKSIPGTEFVKATFSNDSVAQDLFNGDYQVASAEAKLNKLPLLKYLTLKTTQRFGSETAQYSADTELKDTLYFINYIKGNVTYAKDDVNYKTQGGDALQYWGEIKLTDIPMIYSFVPYVTVSYESDDNGNDGLVERKAYFNKDDNNNDWLAKFKAETKISHEALTNWDGLTVKYESRKIEDSKTTDKPADLTKDGQYYVAEARTFIDWYSVLSLSTEYKFPLDVKGKLTYKYDFNHGNASEFEDDGIRVELEKTIGKTTINASYNTKDKDEGKNYTKVVFKTVF